MADDFDDAMAEQEMFDAPLTRVCTYCFYVFARMFCKLAKYLAACFTAACIKAWITHGFAKKSRIAFAYFGGLRSYLASIR